MAYARIEPSGCGIHKNKAKLRLDFFMNPDDPYYDKHHVYVPVIPGEGYPGKVDKYGNPKDQADFNAWIASLPHIWQNNPFHSHFIYPDKGVTDESIKQEIERVLDYFYSFHKACWDVNKEFIDEWKKVPSRAGDIRCPFVKGDPKDQLANEARVTDILARADEFQVASAVREDFKLPEGKGTIDVGSEPDDHTGVWDNSDTIITKINPANASGTIDTIRTWFSSSSTTFRVGFFYPTNGNTLKCRDSATIGNVSSGSEQTFSGLSISVETNDYIGCYYSDGYLEYESGVTAGKWYTDGEYIDQNDETTYTSSSYGTLSLYGTGTEGGAGWTGIAKVSGIAEASIGKVDGIDKASIAKIMGVAV